VTRCLIHFVNSSARSADPTSHLVWFHRCGPQIRNAKPDRAVIDCGDQVPCGNEDVDERYFVCGMCFCSVFVDLLVLTVTMSRPRSPKKTRKVAQQFTVVARGLEGTSFGYASVIV